MKKYEALMKTVSKKKPSSGNGATPSQIAANSAARKSVDAKYTKAVEPAVTKRMGPKTSMGSLDRAGTAKVYANDMKSTAARKANSAGSKMGQARVDEGAMKRAAVKKYSDKLSDKKNRRIYEDTPAQSAARSNARKTATTNMLSTRPSAPKATPKKDSLGASGGWEGMTNMSTSKKIAEMRKAGVDEPTIQSMIKSGKKSK